MTGVSIDQYGIGVSKIRHVPGEPASLENCAYRSSDMSMQAKVLSGLVDEMGVAGTACTHVLQPGEYNLLLVEAPDVEADELKSAVRWRIKDLIDFHIDDAMIDVFDIPGQPHSGNRPTMMYVVAAQSSLIQKRVEMIHSAGLDLSVIDIPELAQRNISSLLPEDVNGVALLTFSENTGLITLCRQSVLYLTRMLDVGSASLFGNIDPDTRQRGFDTVVLEVQRSLDYFESHFAQAPIKSVVISAEGQDMGDLINYLNENLGISSRVLDLGVSIDSKIKLDDHLQLQCMPCISSALRSGMHHQEINLYQPLLRKQEDHFSGKNVINIAAMVLIGLMTVYAAFFWHVSGVRSELASLEQRQKTTTEKLAQVSKDFAPKRKSLLLENEVNAVSTSLEMKKRISVVINDIPEISTRGFAGFFEGMARQHIEGLWLTQFYISDGGKSMNISGKSLDPKHVPAYLKSLAQEQIFEGISFKTFSMNRIEQVAMIDFTLLGNDQGSAP